MKMRRSDRQISDEDAVALLEKCEYGFLATVGEEGAPYGIPLNYVYHEGAVYFHGAQEGRKISNIRHHVGVCFTAVGDTRVLPEKMTTLYESVVVSGRASFLEGEEKRAALILLCEKYTPDCMDIAHREIEKDFDRTCMVKIAIEEMAGKANRRKISQET